MADEVNRCRAVASLPDVHLFIYYSLNQVNVQPLKIKFHSLNYMLYLYFWLCHSVISKAELEI